MEIPSLRSGELTRAEKQKLRILEESKMLDGGADYTDTTNPSLRATDDQIEEARREMHANIALRIPNPQALCLSALKGLQPEASAAFEAILQGICNMAAMAQRQVSLGIFCCLSDIGCFDEVQNFNNAVKQIGCTKIEILEFQPKFTTKFNRRYPWLLTVLALHLAYVYEVIFTAMQQRIALSKSNNAAPNFYKEHKNFLSNAQLFLPIA